MAKKWIYKIIIVTGLPKEDEQALNDEGNEGWELVTIIHEPNMSTATAFLKKEQTTPDGSNQAIC